MSVPPARFCIRGTPLTQALWPDQTPRYRPVDFVFLQVKLLFFLDKKKKKNLTPHYA